MLKFLLNEWSQTPEPWFSKKELQAFSQEDFRWVKYDLPGGPLEVVSHPSCMHGCTLVVDGEDAICLDHPEEGSFPVLQECLLRYRFSIQDFLGELRRVNGIGGPITSVERGHYFGNRDSIGFVLLPLMNPDIIPLIVRTFKDDRYLFVMTPLPRDQVPVIQEDKVVLLSMDEVLDYGTLKLDVEVGLAKLRQRGEKSCLEITGNTKAKGGHEVVINGRTVFISDAPFLLLLRLCVGAVTKEDRWVLTKELTDEGIAAPDSFYQAVNRLKRECDVIENGHKKYRIAPDVEVLLDREKLVGHESGRVRDILRGLK